MRLVFAHGRAYPPSMLPQTRYVRSGDVSIAYQVFGEGPFDLVLILPAGSHIELSWEVPALRAINERLASFARVIAFDKRGMGLSDRSGGLASPETRMDDIRAVMDAAGSTRAAIMGWSEGVRLSLLFAATYPDRAWALVSYGGHAGSTRSREELMRMLAEQRIHRERDMATSVLEEARAGSPAATPEEQAALAHMIRYSLSPGDEYVYEQMNVETDVRHVLSAIAIPTLVLQNAADQWVPNERARDLADRIPHSTYVEVPISGHIPALTDVGPVVDAIESFLRDAWEADAAEREPERVLATVLFTDIVDSTARMAEAGDRAWREVLERHHAIVRAQLARGRGREVDTAGDGFFASFDGPARAVRCAKAIAEGVRELGIDVRSGLHTGECELVDGKISGIAVHTGARVAAHAGAGEVLVSSTVKDLVAGSGLEFEDRGVHELKGIPGEWRLYAAV
jgi:class 3 adenylate cyclase/pimeloyl-ACP methyl ester carboxylesterase